MSSIVWALFITLIASVALHALMERVGLFDMDVTAGFDAGDNGASKN